MTSFCVDEHVPSVFVTTLRSNGYEVVRALDELGEGTDDRRLLAYCAENDHVLVTHDKKDFGGDLGESIDHAGVVIYTDPVPLRSEPARVVRALELVREQYSRRELVGERVWLDQWYDLL